MASSTMDRVSAKTHASIKGVKAELAGLHGVFKVLMQEHGEASALLKRLESQTNTSERAKIWAQVRPALIAHEKGELRTVYPELAGYEQTATLAQAHNEQANELETAIHALDRVGPAHAEWQGLLEELIALVEAHVAVEEGDYFPLAQRTIGNERAEALKQAFLTAKDAVFRSIA